MISNSTRAWRPAAALAAALAAAGCGREVMPLGDDDGTGSVAQHHEIADGDIDPARIELYYQCGTTFYVRNYNHADVNLTWRVEQTGETGYLIAFPAPETSPYRSITWFSTKTVGTVWLFFNGALIRKYANLKTTCPDPQPLPDPPPPPPSPTNGSLGGWTGAQQWPVVPIHTSLLPTGKLLAWSRLGDAHTWDPAQNLFTRVAAPSWLFCASSVFLPDGNLVVAGGHMDEYKGLPDVNLFNPFTNTWSSQPKMARGRWYASTVAMPGGETLIVAGTDQNAAQNPIPEVRRADGSIRQLTSAYLEQPYYPYMFLVPDGRVFYAGPTPGLTRWLDTAGTGRWISGPYTASRIVRNYGSAVMYEPGKLMVIGGGLYPPVNSVEAIDLNLGSAATWKMLAPMKYARRMLNATILPDGQILVTGGTSADGFNNAAGAVLTPELYNPQTNTWRTLQPMKIPRLYHSTAALLPDGRVMSGGGGEGGGGKIESNIEVFSPPYLFKSDGTAAARPAISSAPARFTYNETFTVDTAQAADIAQVTLIRLPSTTHGQNMDQRFMRLTFSKGAGALTVTAPSKATIAPQGHYMLFVVDSLGVPSAAKIVQIF